MPRFRNKARHAAAGRDRLAAIAIQLASLQKTLATEFPGYAVLSNPLPPKAKEIQTLLASDEAMVLFALADQGSYVLALTRDHFDWQRIPPGADALSQKVAAFRRGLDVGRASDASGKTGLFDLALASELHVALLALIGEGAAR